MLLVTEKFINISVNIKLEGATMNSMSNVRGRKVPNKTPRVLEGSGYRSRRRHGEGGGVMRLSD
jgi:hypothetical protein